MSKKKIAFITNADTRCGIYNYSVSATKCLVESNKYEYTLYPVKIKDRSFLTAEESEKYLGQLKIAKALAEINCDAYIYNWCPITLSWVDYNFILLSSQLTNRPHFVISGHDFLFVDLLNPKHPDEFKFPHHVWSVDPDFGGFWPVTLSHMDPYSLPEHERKALSKTGKFSALPRPIIKYAGIRYSPPSGSIKIGTFGFGSDMKGFKKMLQTIARDFVNEPVSVWINLSPGNHAGYDKQKQEDDIANDLRTQAIPSNIDLNITFNFIDDQYELVKWLNQFDLIMFHYEPLLNRFAVSSAIDFALSAQKPIAITRSKMFSHIDVGIANQISVEDNNLHDIIARGISVLEPLHRKWNPQTFQEEVESRLDKFLKEAV